jgi:hypothetical protein
MVLGWSRVAADPGAWPAPRYQHAATADLRRGRVVLFGGGNGATNVDDLWEFDPGSPAPVATAAVFGIGCSSPPLTIAPSASSRPLLGNQYATDVGNLVSGPCLMTFGSSSSHLGALALPIDLSIAGISGCRLYHDLALAVEPCQPSGPTTARHELSLPSVPTLVGLRLYLQAWAAAPGLNTLGVMTSNAIELVLGST